MKAYILFPESRQHPTQSPNFVTGHQLLLRVAGGAGWRELERLVLQPFGRKARSREAAWSKDRSTRRLTMTLMMLLTGCNPTIDVTFRHGSAVPNDQGYYAIIQPLTDDICAD